MSFLQRIAAILRNPRVLIPVLGVSSTALVAGAGRLAFQSWLIAILIALGVVLAFLLGFLLWSLLTRDRERRLRAGTLGREDPERASEPKVEATRDDSATERFQEGLAALRTSRLARELPWYLVLGAPGAGKTSLLRVSGLDLPAEYEGLVDSGPTASVSWWLTNQAVLLEATGRYLESDEGADRREWRRLLRLIRRNGPRVPLSGLIVCLPIPSLLEANPGEIDELAHQLRRRINEVNEELRLDVPIYLVLTKTDLIPGVVDLANSLPRERLDDALGWTHSQRLFDDAGASMSRGFDEVIRGLDQLLPELVMREPDAERRRRLFLLPRELEETQAVARRLLTRTFESSIYAERPFLRGLYLTSALQSGRCTSLLLNRLGHEWANNQVEQITSQKGLFVRWLMRGLIVDEEEQTLSTPTRELGSWTRRILLGMGASAAAIFLGLSGVSFVGSWQGLQQVSEDATSALLPSPRIEALDRLRVSIQREELRSPRLWHGMGLSSRLDAGLDRARMTFSRPFEREQEQPTKLKLIREVQRLDSEAFGALAVLARDVVWMQTRGDADPRSRPNLLPYTSPTRDARDFDSKFRGSYDAWVRWAWTRDQTIRTSIRRESDILESATAKLLSLRNLDHWCEASAEDCPPLLYSDLGLPPSDTCEIDGVRGSFTRNTWTGLIQGLLQAVERAGSAPAEAVERFREDYRRRFRMEWRDFLLCSTLAARAEPSVTDSPYVKLLATIAMNTDLPELWQGEQRPDWLVVLEEIRRSEPTAEDETPPWTRYERALNSVAEDSTRAFEDPEEALGEIKRQSGYREAIALVEELVPVSGPEHQVVQRLQTLMKLPILNGLSAALSSALGAIDRRWQDRISSPYSGAIGWREMQTLYAPGGVLDRFKSDVLGVFYEDGRPRAILGDRGMPFGPRWLSWMAQAEALQPMLGSTSPRTIRFVGIPSVIRGRRDIFVTRRELRLRCPDGRQQFVYREGTGSQGFSWSPQCTDLELHLWVRGSAGNEHELQPIQRWPGAMGMREFLLSGHRVSDDLYEWNFDYPRDDLAVSVRYSIEGREPVMRIAHAAPPASVRD